jgi:voltage-gated potassium channel Kch
MATPRQILRYRFDNLMARGAGAQMLVLGLLTGGAIVLTALTLIALDLVPKDETGESESFSRLLWRGLMRAMDAGAVGGDAGSWSFLFVMLAITLVGIFVLSALIGILNGALERVLENLRKGRSFVVERNHVVILGYSPKIHTLLSELAEANANHRGACVVVLADRDKVEMDDEIALRLGGRLRVVTRSGSPTDPTDLALVNLRAARTVIVPAPEAPAGHEVEPRLADTVVLKALLAVSKAEGVQPGRPHIVAELKDARTHLVARQVVGPTAALVLSTPLISRLLVQTGRQSGLSSVYTELLDFGGCEIYTAPQPVLNGKTFREALAAYEGSAPLGVLTAGGDLRLAAFEHRFGPGDQLVVLSEDDDTIRLDARPGTLRTELIVEGPASAPPKVERTLVLGASERLELVLGELDAYAAPGSQVTVVGDLDTDAVEPRLERAIKRLTRIQTSFRAGDVTDRDVLDSLETWAFDHVIVLAETRQHGHEMADARTLITLLHLRDQGRRVGRVVPVTTEMLDLRNQALAQATDADDFIVSDTLVSLMMTQVAENPHLVQVFEELFSPEGHELYLKPASHFVQLRTPVSFATVVESAARKGMVALGHRVGGKVGLNPAKSALATYGELDKVVVIADS